MGCNGISFTKSFTIVILRPTISQHIFKNTNSKFVVIFKAYDYTGHCHCMKLVTLTIAFIEYVQYDKDAVLRVVLTSKILHYTLYTRNFECSFYRLTTACNTYTRRSACSFHRWRFACSDYTRSV